jgi:hypothetical protein
MAAITGQQNDLPADCPQGVVIAEAQLVLAEKRTSLAAVRTGIAVMVLPLSVVGLLVATSHYYEVAKVLHLLIPLLLICAGLTGVGFFLIIRALKKIQHQDLMIAKLKARCTSISEFME